MTRKNNRARIQVHNLPEYVMYLLGFIIVYLLGLIYLVGFLIYFIFSKLWFLKFICTNCPHYDGVKCPSGHAKVASRLFKKGDFSKFQIMFRRHIAVVFPMWFIPVIAGIYILLKDFSLLAVFLLLVFIIDGFIILPIISKKFGCNECELRDRCPWMGGFGK